MRTYGIIGYPLGHSFSPDYFSNKFKKLGIEAQYLRFDMPGKPNVKQLFSQNTALVGVNVTIPHKVAVIDQLDALDHSAQKIGAVNVIKRVPEGLKGFNTDYYGFKTALENFLPPHFKAPALVLGTGGASKAVVVALADMELGFKYVSRNVKPNAITYQSEALMHAITTHKLIINCTPLGTSPHIDAKPDIPYNVLTPEHYVFDLVYNPENTAFMMAAQTQGAKTKNGLEMLHQQAEKAWQIWNNHA